MAGLIAVSLESSVVLAQPADTLFAPPPVPVNLEVPAGNTLCLKGEAKGTQNYACLPSAESKTRVAFKLFTPHTLESAIRNAWPGRLIQQQVGKGRLRTFN